MKLVLLSSLLVVTACAAERPWIGAFGEPPVAAGAYTAYIRGTVALAGGDTDEAASEFALAARLAPDDAGPKLALARVEAERGRLDRAEALLLEIRRRWPDSLDAELELAELGERRGDDEAAIAAYRRARALSPADRDAALGEAALLRDRGRPRDAMAALTQAAQAKDPEAMRELGRAMLDAGEPKRALATLIDAAALAPGDAPIVVLMARAQLALGNDGEARRVVNDAWARFGRDDDSLSALVGAALDDGGPAAAIQLLGWLDVDTLDEAALLTLAAAAAGAHDLTHEERFVNRAARRPDATDAARLAVADALAHRGDTTAALAAFAAIPDGSPVAPAARLGAVVLATSAGDLVRAGKLLDAARPLLDDVTFALAKAELADAAGDARHARDILDAAAAAAPSSNALATARAAAHARTGDLDGALREIAPFLAAEPDSASWLNLAGYLRAVAGARLDEAEPLLWRAVEASPDDAAILDSWGFYLVRAGRARQGQRVLERAARLAPDSAEIRWHLGVCAHARGDDAAARKAWNEGLGMNPEPAVKRDLHAALGKR